MYPSTEAVTLEFAAKVQPVQPPGVPFRPVALEGMTGQHRAETSGQAKWITDVPAVDGQAATAPAAPTVHRTSHDDSDGHSPEIVYTPTVKKSTGHALGRLVGVASLCESHLVSICSATLRCVVGHSVMIFAASAGSMIGINPDIPLPCRGHDPRPPRRLPRTPRPVGATDPQRSVNHHKHPWNPVSQQDSAQRTLLGR